MEEPVRIRLLFDDRHLLNKAQRSQGLRRCWLLLPPDLVTVADLADHVTRRFCLRGSRPDGLVLSMDEFVLPSFESTSIFRDKDIVRVKKAACKKEVIEINGDVHCIQDPMAIDKQPVLSNNEVLAIDFHEDVGGHRSGSEDCANEDGDNAIHQQSLIREDTNSKGKRKHADKPESSKRKKLKLTNSENLNLHSKEKSSKEYKGLDALDGCQINVVSKETGDSVLKGEKNNQVEENGQMKTSKPQISDDVEKLPSRSARRKKAKRRWKRESASCQLEESLQREDVENEVQCTSLDHQTVIQNTELEEIVPVIVRPGHIRFEPADEEQSNLQSTGSKLQEDRSVETLMWNGITSKKKGQKWGREKAIRRSNDDNAFDEWVTEKIVAEEGKQVDDHLDFESLSPLEGQPKETLMWNGKPSKKKGQKWGREKAIRRSNDDNSFDEWVIGKIVAEEGKQVDDHLDFESLSPLERQPKEGDVIVYRLVELSTSWCPELSPNRVGKVSSYDNVSTRIILVTVPEYPIFLDGEEDMEITQQNEMSVYNEDGSLEIEYPSLVNVRILKDANLEPVTISSVCSERNKLSAPPETGEVNSGKRISKDNSKVALAENNMIDSASASTGSKSNIGWEQIHQALNEKKSELQANGCSKSTNTTWSYRALRGSALGPTLALLRGKTVENGKDYS